MDDFEQVQQQGLVTEFGAIDEGVGAVGSQGAGDIGLAAPYRLILVHAQTKHEKVRIGAAEVMEGIAERVLGPALRIFLCCVFEETREGGDELRERFAQIKIACQVSSLGDDEVIGVAQERKEARGCIRRVTGGTESTDRFQVGLDRRVAHLLLRVASALGVVARMRPKIWYDHAKRVLRSMQDVRRGECATIEEA